MATKPLVNNPTADLPENWTDGQTIAADGSSVGLSTQHGYNYLNSKVNEALEDIGAINDAFGTTVPSPSAATPSNVGTSGAAGSSTDYARADHVHALPATISADTTGNAATATTATKANALVPTETSTNAKFPVWFAAQNVNPTPLGYDTDFQYNPGLNKLFINGIHSPVYGATVYVNSDSGNVVLGGGGQLLVRPGTGDIFIKGLGTEGGQIQLGAPPSNNAKPGTIIDNLGEGFRIFGTPSADGTTYTGFGTPFVVYPYAAQAGVNYTWMGSVSATGKVINKSGTYVGTGTFSAGTPSTLTLAAGAPKLFILAPVKQANDALNIGNAGYIMLIGVDNWVADTYYEVKGIFLNPASASVPAPAARPLYAKFNGTTLSWYGTTAAYQFNVANITYEWIALY